MHQGQIDGAIVMGVGYALMEDVQFDDDKVTTANLGDYKIPTIRDVPELRTALIQSDLGSGPYNSMSIGETPIIPFAAAVANARGRRHRLARPFAAHHGREGPVEDVEVGPIGHSNLRPRSGQCPAS